MPMEETSLYGRNNDNTLNEEYCQYCYKDGSFTSDCTMEEMIQQCLLYLEEFNKDSEIKFTKEDALKFAREEFPKLKRWKK